MTYDDKVHTLKTLVSEAIWERDEVGTLPFDGTFDTPELDRLLNVLKTTDALDVLNDVLNKKENK